jgi:hypothetical protein
VRADGARVGEEDIEAAVLRQGVVDHCLDRLLVGGVKLPRVDVDQRPQGVDLALVRVEVGGIVVADVDGLCAVLGELVGRGAADAEDGVCAWELVSIYFRDIFIKGLLGRIPVMMMTLSATRGPWGATLKMAGTEPAASWLPMACTRRFADSDMVSHCTLSHAFGEVQYVFSTIDSPIQFRSPR